VPLAEARAGGGPSNAIVTVLTALLGIAGVVTGAAITHVSSVRRDRARAEFEAHQDETDRYPPAYRSFLASWRKSTAPSHLEKAFDDLRVNTPVPSRLRDVYEQTLVTLRDSGKSREDEHSAAEELRVAVEALIVTRAEERR
jgi:hypothetical protein